MIDFDIDIFIQCAHIRSAYACLTEDETAKFQWYFHSTYFSPDFHAQTKEKIFAELDINGENEDGQATEEHESKNKSYDSLNRPELPFDDVEYNNLVAKSCVSIFMIFNHSIL